MEKPISLMIEEARNNIVTAINESNLPACILESIIKDFYNDIHNLHLKEIEEDKQKYEASLAEEKDKKDNKDNK